MKIIFAIYSRYCQCGVTFTKVYCIVGGYVPPLMCVNATTFKLHQFVSRAKQNLIYRMSKLKYFVAPRIYNYNLYAAQTITGKQ